MARPMGMGKIYTAENFGRKFRFEFSVVNDAQLEGLTSFCKRITSPNLTLEPVEVVHQTEKVYFPGRITWGTIDVILIDIDGADGSLNLIWEKWVRKYYNDPKEGKLSWDFSSFKKTCVIQGLDARGNQTGYWTMEGAWPTTVQVGEWDYSSGEVQEISMSLQFDRAYFSRG